MSTSISHDVGLAGRELTAAEETGLRRDALGFWGVFAQGLAAAAPSVAVASVPFMLFVAAGKGASWAVIVGPAFAARFEPSLVKSMLEPTWLSFGLRYALAATVVAAQLLALHLWLVAGKRRIGDVLPGVVLSTLLWIGAGALYSYYLEFSDYSRFYAGLSQLMVALIFFQVTAVIIILGAELNRGLMELRKLSAANGKLSAS